ncbi:MAG: universal stress protein [Terriglobia bacterium]|jgi:nucleotide-binding universal stress UspA family protein
MLPPKVIVSPVDFSTHSDDALKTAADLSLLFGSELCLVHVVPALPKLPSVRSLFNEAEYEQALHSDAEKQLAQMVEEIARRGIAAKYAVGTANDTAMEVLRTAEHNHADLIVIATHGMSGWHQLAFGSVAEKVVRLSPFPVLVLRARPENKSSDASPTRDSAVVAR